MKNYIIGTAAALIVILILLEIALRILNPAYSLQLIEEKNGAQHFLVLNEKDPGRFAFFRYDSALGWKPAANASGRMMTEEYAVNVSMNKEGFRDVDHALQKPPGKFRIAVLGDSYAWGYGANYHERFGEALEQKNGSFEVLNFAAGGWGNAQELLAFEQYGAKYKPDAVVMLVFLDNDLADNEYWEGRCDRPYYILQGDGSPVLKNDTSASCGPCRMMECGQGGFRDLVKASPATDFLLNFEVGRFGLDIAKRMEARGEASSILPHLQMYNTSDSHFEPRLAITTALLGVGKNIAESSGARFYVFYFSARHIVNGSWNAQDFPGFEFEGPNARIADYCKKNGISCFDLNPALRDAIAAGGKPFYPKDGHFTPQGNAVVADEIYQRMQRG